MRVVRTRLRGTSRHEPAPAPGITTITFRIWTLLHTGVESHLAGVALITLAVLSVAAPFAVVVLKVLLLSGRRPSNLGDEPR